MRSFSIITVCKGRLEHLKQSLPQMVRQTGAEVIVVDYSDPDGSGDYVERNFPQVTVVRVEGEEGFSNWKARNRGAAAATGDLLMFCDADTILADGATAVIDSTMAVKAYGFFTRNSTAHFNRSGLRLGKNQLRGFQVVPRAAFTSLGGYDEVLTGYAAGGDTDMEERLALFGFKPTSLGDGIVDAVLEHDNAARVTFHGQSIKRSYATGLIYRRAKMTILRARRKGLTLAERTQIYAAAQKAVAGLDEGRKLAAIQFHVEDSPVGMPRQLGFERAKCSVAITVRLTLDGKMVTPPQ